MDDAKAEKLVSLLERHAKKGAFSMSELGKHIDREYGPGTWKLVKPSLTFSMVVSGTKDLESLRRKLTGRKRGVTPPIL
jgi:hypothetical protein